MNPTFQLGQVGRSMQRVVDPTSNLLMRFESTLFDDENGIQSNSFGSTGSPVRVTTSPKWGLGNAEINAGTNTQQSFYAQGATDFRANGAAATLDLWFMPTAGGVSSNGGLNNGVRGVFCTFATNATIHTSPNNITGALWWDTDSAGTLGFGSDRVTGVAANTWHHIRLCWSAGNGLQGWCDGTRFLNASSGVTHTFNVISIGNQYTAGLESDGLAGNYLIKCRIDSLRVITGTALSTGSSITVPTADFL